MPKTLTLERIAQLKSWEPRTGKLALSDDEFHYLLDLAEKELPPASGGKWNAIHDDDGSCRIYEGNDTFRFVIQDEELADRVCALLNQPASSGKWRVGNNWPPSLFRGDEHIGTVIAKPEHVVELTALLNQPRVTPTREQLVDLTLNFVHHVITEEGFEAKLREMGVEG